MKIKIQHIKICRMHQKQEEALNAYIRKETVSNQNFKTKYDKYIKLYKTI